MTAAKQVQQEDALSIYQIIPKVRAEVGAVPKSQQATGGARYSYRSADSVTSALVPALNKYGVFTTVEDFDVTHASELTASKKVLTTVTMKKRVRFYGPQGDYVESVVASENSDYSDKATGGASTYAYRYALLQTFTLPTDEDDPDAKYVEREAPATASAPAAPDEDVSELKKKVENKAKAVEGDIKGARYLQVLADSVESGHVLHGTTINSEWKSISKAKLEALDNLL
jgi:hypothetical protein